MLPSRVMFRYLGRRGGFFIKSLTDMRGSYSTLENAADELGLVEQTVPHVPVMAKEVVSMLNPQPGQTILDLTFGAGGHTKRILNACDSVVVLGLDRDPVAFSYAEKIQQSFSGRFFPMLGRFSEVPKLLKDLEIDKVDGILLDLGCSSMQFDTPERGFAISAEGPLDMRMDGNRFPDQPTAADVLQYIDEEPLARILKCYGEEKQSKKIARAIVEARYLFKRLKTTSELAYLVESVLDSEKRLDKLGRPTHAATKTFQAIRMFVNNEMNELNRVMEIAHEILNPGGKIVVLTFHSLEDRIVKRHLIGIDMDEPVSSSIGQKYRNSLSWHTEGEITSIFDQKWSLVNKHVIVPSIKEVEENPRSRSAKLRCAVKNS